MNQDFLVGVDDWIQGDGWKDTTFLDPLNEEMELVEDGMDEVGLEKMFQERCVNQLLEALEECHKFMSYKEIMLLIVGNL